MDLSRFQLFDCHFHIIDRRFPLVPSQGYLPPEFTCDDYLKAVEALRVVGGAVVSGSFQAFDYSYLLDALRRLGSGFVGVVNLRVTASDEEILMLHQRGVRAVRFNLYRGGPEALEHLESLARRVYELVGWHVELYVDSRELEALFPLVASLPAVSIDHLGLSREGFPFLLRLVERGVRVKATGFGRVDLDVPWALRTIQRVNPGALMFGTDLPSTRAPRPFSMGDAELVVETLGEEEARRVFYGNAVEFYAPPC